MRFVLIIILAYILASCNQPASPEILVDNPYKPQENDSRLDQSTVFLEKVEWEAAENKLHLIGNLPTPCNQLRVAHSQSNGKLEFNIYSLSDPDMMCAQVLQPFEVILAVSELPQQGIPILVNGEVIFSP